MPTNTCMSSSMGHVPMWPTKKKSSFKLDVNGVMLGWLHPSTMPHYFWPSPWQTLEYGQLQFSNLQPFLCESGRMASLTIDMTSMLFLTTSLEKQPQKTIHFEVNILLLWQASITKKSNLLRQFTIDWASTTLGMVLMCNKEGVFNSRGWTWANFFP